MKQDFQNENEDLGTLSSDSLVGNWGILFGYGGRRKSYQQIERTVGIGIVLGSLLLLVVGFGLVLFGNDNFAPRDLLFGVNIESIVLWTSSLGLGYGSYLLRSRDLYEDFQTKKDLFFFSSRKTSEKIFVTEHLSNDLFNLFDHLFYTDRTQFWNNFVQQARQDAKSMEILKRLGLDNESIEALFITRFSNPDFFSAYRQVFLRSFELAADMESIRVYYYHFFIAILQLVFVQRLLELGVTHDDIAGMVLWLKNDQKKLKYESLWSHRSMLKPKGPVNRAYTSVYAQNLEQYSDDYTHQAAAGLFELAIGRESEVEQLISKVRTGEGSAVMMVAKPGVGKTRLLRHLAVRLVVEDVPSELRDMRLVAFQFSKAFSYIKSLDEFKYVVQSVFDEVARSKDIILVMDDIDQLLNIRSEVSAEIMNLIINSVSKLRIKVIVTTTYEAFVKYIQPNSALVNAFRIINLEEPNSQVVKQIIFDEFAEIQSRYGVQFVYKGVKQLIDLADKLPHDKAMPSRALAAMAEIAVAAQSQGITFIDDRFVSTIISSKLGVNVGSLSSNESEKLMNLEATMHERVIGQEAAVKALAAALRRARAGLDRNSKPIASFLFYGPTGVGKTEVTKTLAATYFGDEKSMVRIDMSEYQEQENLSRLIGSQENGQFVGGYLTEPIRNRPFSLVLLDELEKANPKVLDLFLQILDEGSVTDGLGRKVDFNNTIIIATSNAASRQIAEGIIAGKSYDEVYQDTLPELRNVYRVEFLNRFDQVIMFKPLGSADVEKIVSLVLSKFVRKLEEKGMHAEFADQVIKQLGQLAYNPIYGAREVGRVVQDRVETYVADQIIAGNLRGGMKIVFNTLEDIRIITPS